MSFRRDIAPTSVQTLKERVKAPGTIESVRIRFYPGQQLALNVNPYVLHKGNRAENLISYATGTNQYLNGDDDRFEYPVVVTVDYDDELAVWVQNTDTVNVYTVVVDIVVDYYGGLERVI